MPNVHPKIQHLNIGKILKVEYFMVNNVKMEISIIRIECVRLLEILKSVWKFRNYIKRKKVKATFEKSV